MSTDHSLNLHPEIQQLREDNALLQEELVALLTECETLVHTVKPNLLAIYQTKIGVWELRVLKAQFKVARLRRQIELAQACINRGERPNLATIEFITQLDLYDWINKLDAAAERIRAAEQRLQHFLSPADDRELKKLYYALAKRCHPDANPNLTDDQRRLWARAQAAYKAGDLMEMRALALLAEKSAAIPPVKSLDALRRDQATLQQQIAATLKRLDQTQRQPPFTLRGQLEDEVWLTNRRKELDDQAATLRSQADTLNTRWQQILSDVGYGTSFSQN